MQLPDELDEATKLTVYVGRQERVYRMPAFVAVCDLLYRRGIAGATVLLGVDGTSRGRRARAKFFGRNADVPMMIIAVGSGEQIAQVLPELGGLLHEPLITLERVRVCKRDGELLATPHELPGTDEHGLAMWQKLMIYTSHAATHDGHPLHRALVRRLRESDAAGATSLRGIWGFHGDHAPHGDKFFQIRRHVPVCTIVIDTPERTAAIVRDHRRAHRRARPRHQRDGPRDDRDERERARGAAPRRPRLLMGGSNGRKGGAGKHKCANRRGPRSPVRHRRERHRLRPALQPQPLTYIKR